MRRRAIRWVRPFRASGEVIANQTGHTCLHNHRMWMFDGDCCEQSHPWVYPCRIRRKGRKVEHLGVYLSGPFFLWFQRSGPPAPVRGGSPELDHPDYRLLRRGEARRRRTPKMGRSSGDSRFAGGAAGFPGPTGRSSAKPSPPKPDHKYVRALLGAAAAMRYNLSRKLRKDWRRLN